MTERNIVTSIILTIVTCGIYGIYWFIVLTDDVKKDADDQEFSSVALAFVLTLVTCGIYGLYWAYKMGQLTAKAQEKHGLPVTDNSVLYLILDIFGLSIVVYALVQVELNKMVTNNTTVA